MADHLRLVEDEPVKKWWVRLGGALAEFFNPRDWVPSIPTPRKPPPGAQGYQTLGEALRGFKKDD